MGWWGHLRGAPRVVPIRLFLLTLCGALLSFACERTPDPGWPEPVCSPESKWTLTTGAFQDHYVPVGSDTLEQEGPAGILWVRVLDHAPSGAVLMADSRRFRMIVRSPKGKLRVLGQRGPGPGEFASLVDARFLPNGSLVGLDPKNTRATRYSADGEYELEFDHLGQDARMLVPVGDSMVAIAGLVDPGTEPRTMALYDWSGERLGTYGGSPGILDATWRVVDDSWIVHLEDGVFYVGLAILPSFLRVDTRNNSSCVIRPPTRNWRRIALLDQRPPTLGELQRWIDPSTIATWAALDESRRLYRYASSQDEDVSTLYSYDLQQHTAVELEGVPGRVLALRPGGELTTIALDGEGSVVLTRFLPVS